MRGIYFNQKHSWYWFHAVISKSVKPVPAKKLCDETVPFASVLYDFSCLNGKQSYEARTLEYVLTFREQSRAAVIRKYEDIVKWLYAPMTRIPLYDDDEPFVHYMAKCVSISAPEYTGCVCSITVTFSAEPLRIPNRPSVVYTTETAPFPDVDMDDSVTATDAAMILSAAAAIGAGEDPGLTAEQLDRADADRDGEITSSDALLVQDYVASCGAGDYANTAEGWVKFLNDTNARQEGRI